ncbi:hypothetical protein L1887_22434 [Cichorium endivia]|nr:hypothetical protein L1887_22434 [Cichorium endivia]
MLLCGGQFVSEFGGGRGKPLQFRIPSPKPPQCLHGLLSGCLLNRIESGKLQTSRWNRFQVQTSCPTSELESTHLPILRKSDWISSKCLEEARKSNTTDKDILLLSLDDLVDLLMRATFPALTSCVKVTAFWDNVISFSG